METVDVASELAELKDRALKASSENDRDFYASYLADDAVAILPFGQLSKAQVLGSMVGAKAPFSAKRIEDTDIKVLGPDVGVVTYKAIYDRDGREFAVAATTVYRRQDGRWQGVLYQQTRLERA